MKKKLLILSTTILLCCSFVSCNLKDAITGTNTNAPESSDETSNNNDDGNRTVLVNDANNSTDTVTDSDVTTTDNTILSSEDDKNGTSLATTDNSSTSNDNSSTSTTSNNVTSNTVNRNCRIFYFNTSDLKSYYVDTTVSVVDNAFTTALTTKLYTSPDSSDNFIVIPEEFGVKSANLDEETGILKVVFNEDFTNTIPLGTSSESGLISAVVNTYGYNYGVDKVAIYFGDTLYTGLKGELPEGYYTVSTEDSIKLN